MRPDDPKLKRLEPPRLSVAERMYLPQIVAGLVVTAEHMAGVVFGNKAITVQYRAVTAPGPSTAAATGSGAKARASGLRGLQLPELVAGADAPVSSANANAEAASGAVQ